MESDEVLQQTIDAIHRQLDVAMFLTGSARIADLKKARIFISGRTRQMIKKTNPAVIKK
jgi:isopentenyl-diphosphate delta-isomerase